MAVDATVALDATVAAVATVAFYAMAPHSIETAFCFTFIIVRSRTMKMEEILLPDLLEIPAESIASVITRLSSLGEGDCSKGAWITDLAFSPAQSCIVAEDYNEM